MIEDNWNDGVCYDVYFKTVENRKLYRSVIVPLGFSEEEIVKLFRLSFESTIKVLEISEVGDIWLPKKYFTIQK